MSTPQAKSAFLSWLEKEIEEAETEARKLRDSHQEEGYRDGYAEGLRDCWRYFYGA